MPDVPGEYDAIVIGTGFAGAVTALRLVQAGRRICVLERGRRYGPDDFPIHPPERPGASSNGAEEEAEEQVLPDFSRLSWRMGRGLWDVRDLGDVIAAQAAGYGGGSLIYANVHLRAPPEVFERDWPREYSRARLDEYYDLAAYMLDVKPLPPALVPAKTAQLRHAAGKLGREGAFFFPPLAVNFGDGTPAQARPSPRREEVRAGRPQRDQGTCNLCGGCCFGCRRQAKNTLDLNYLAIAEEAQHGDQPLADVRTLCEVTSIRSVSHGNVEGYEVEYVDHVVGARGERGRVRSPYVFLCAGAINTTELLLRSLESGQLAVTGKGLGERYHPNADALAVVFDCDSLHEADRGPTIGGALLYTREEKERGGEGAGTRRDWLLLEDGGIPAALEPLLGVFRSPLWGARNRHRDVPPDQLPRSQPPPLARLPIDSLTDVFAGLTRGALNPNLRFAHGINEQLLASLGRKLPGESSSADLPLRRWSLVPNQLRDALQAQRAELLERLADAAEPSVSRFLDKTADRIEDNYDLEADLLRSVPLPGVDTAGLGQRDLVRKAMELVVQLLWGSEGELVRTVSSEILDALVPEKGELAGRVAELLRWALDYRLGDSHTGVLLCMGRDSKPGTLSLAGSGRGSRALRATLPPASELPERSVQEQLLRDVAGADAWRGELRSEPTWAFLGKRLTVHSQGGCPMGSVTRADGQVEGCRGLYVMDAAAFPTPVGVNPSASIAAIAEYKVERFIRETGQTGWRADEMARARSWARARRDWLDPIASLRMEHTQAPGHEPIGFRFEEVMKGFHAAPEPGQQPGVREYRVDELRGIDASGTIETRLEIEIEDLGRFLELHRRGERPRASLNGNVTLGGLPGAPTDAIPLCRECPDESYLEIFPHQTRAGSERNLHYRLHFHVEGEPWFLEGTKFIDDDAGFDVWEDTTRLFFEISRGRAGNVLRRGVLRTPVSEFFGMQLPSFRATNTKDPARQAWALAAFGRFFFGNLLEVYVPELDRVADLAKRIAERTHV